MQNLKSIELAYKQIVKIINSHIKFVKNWKNPGKFLEFIAYNELTLLNIGCNLIWCFFRLTQKRK